MKATSLAWPPIASWKNRPARTVKRATHANPNCPISRSLDQVGEWWSILILRDATLGVTRFDDFQRGTGIATNMLTRRLRSLVDNGLLERRPYQTRPVRHEYRLTDKGRDFLPVLITLADWGDRWLLGDQPFRFVSTESGATVDPVLIDRNTGQPIHSGSVRPAFDPPATAPALSETEPS